jgi:hypothetical protein
VTPAPWVAGRSGVTSTYPRRIGVVLRLRTKQDPGSLQGPGPDDAAPRSPLRNRHHLPLTVNRQHQPGRSGKLRRSRVADWVTACQILRYPTRRADRFWPPRTDRRTERASPSPRDVPRSSAIVAKGRMAQVGPDQLAAPQRLPAAFDHVPAARSVVRGRPESQRRPGKAAQVRRGPSLR